MRRVTPLALLALLALATLPASPGVAHACGGFFCSTQPVGQAGERIFYAIDDDRTLTMVVEITYQGFDDEFAWIVPMPRPPTLSVGTSDMFDALDELTAPSWEYEERVEGICRDHPRCVLPSGREPTPAYCSGDTTSEPPTYVDTTTSTTDSGVSPIGTTDDGVTVFSQAPVGPYESVVLGAHSADEVARWLTTNGYTVPPASVPLLEPYVAAGDVFVALRLRPNVASTALRPIVLRAPGVDACLPIRLTAIATTPKLPITAYFAARAAVVPTNFALAEVDPNDGAFWLAGRSWVEAVEDDVVARGGQAFAIAYSGRPPALSLALPSVLDLAGETDAGTFLRALRARGYRGDGLLLAVVEAHLVPPAGTDPTTYFNCLTSTSARCDPPVAFDPAGLAADVDADVTQPRVVAEGLLTGHARLTRLYTSIAVEAMTLDPEFAVDDTVAEVPSAHRAVLVRHCDPTHYREDAPQDLVVDEGTVLDLRAGGRRIASAPGIVSDDVAYCESFGAVVATGASETVRRCGYATGCSAVADAPVWAGAYGLFVLVSWPWVERWRRRRRP